MVAILTAPFLPAKRLTVAVEAEAEAAQAAEAAAVAAAAAGPAEVVAGEPIVDVPLHVHTGVWPLNMGVRPMAQKKRSSDADEDGGEEEPEQRLIEIDEIPFMTKGERRLAREVELQHARLR